MASPAYRGARGEVRCWKRSQDNRRGSHPPGSTFEPAHASLAEMPAQTPHVFISYAHAGDGVQVLDRLVKLLDTLALEKRIWSDQEIDAGDDWRDRIQEALRNAAAAVLLIDEDFLNSRFIETVELPALLATRREAREAAFGCTIVPVLVQDCFYRQKLPELSAKQYEPENTLRKRIDKDRQRFPELLTLEDVASAEYKADVSRFYNRLVTRLDEILKQARTQQRNASGSDGGDAIGERDSGRASESLKDDWSTDSGRDEDVARYLLRGEDVTRDSVDVQISLLPAEWTTYRVGVRYSYIDRGDQKTQFWRGLIHLDVHGAGPADRHPGEPLLDLDLQGGTDAGDVTVLSVIRRARAKALELKVPVQLRLAVSAGAGELHEIPWESLPVGDDGPIGAHGGILFSRAVLSIGDDPVEFQARAHAGMRLLGVVNTAGASSPGAASADAQRILNAMRESVAPLLAEGDNATSLDAPDRATFEAMLLDGPESDVLYLACEAGTAANDYHLCFSDGNLTRSHIAGLFRTTPVPRLVILVPLSVATDTEPNEESVLAMQHVAAHFLRLGVPAVLALNAAVPAGVWHAFVGNFAEALSRHGHVPGAVLLARRKLTGKPEQTRPVLFSRLKMARLWFTPGFVSDDRASTEGRWQQLLASLRDRRLCPVIGPGIDHRLQQQRVMLARDLADKHGFPLGFSHRIDLPSVAQYVRAQCLNNTLFTEEFERHLRERFQAVSAGKVSDDSGSLSEYAYRIAQSLLADAPDYPYNGLARLPIELYLTTALGPFMEAALDLRKKSEPEVGVRRLEDHTVLDFSKVDVSRADADPHEILKSNRFSEENPLVVHFFGSYSDIGKAVITEDDYYEALVNFNERMVDVRSALRGKLSNVDLVFLGFKWNSLDFRIIFRALQRYADKFNENAFHLAVQLDPDDDDTLHPEKVREYLRRHLGGASRLPQARLSLFLGSPEDFIRELLARWSDANGGSK